MPTPTNPLPPYACIADELRRRIAAGELRPGDRVPSTRAIMREWGVAMATATKALASLQHEGLVRSAGGAGTVVCEPRTGRSAPREGGATREPAPPRAQRRHDAHEAEPLGRERIVRTGIEVADAEGLAAVSMRRIAAELGVAPMALYRHVADKDELVLHMADAVFAKVRPPQRANRRRGFRAELEALARAQWALYLQHPWMAEVVSLSFSRPEPLPSAMAHTEWALDAIDDLGLDATTRLHVAVTVSGYVHGTALKLVSEIDAEQDTGLTQQQWMESVGTRTEAALASGRLPMLAKLMAEGGVDLDLESLFEFGLRVLLDGFEALVARQGRARSSRG